MTEETFEELVNLYLDGEISAHDRELLRREVGRNAARRRAFEERRRLHLAMRAALSPDSAEIGTTGGESGDTGDAGAGRGFSLPVAAAAGFGLAACLAVALIWVGSALSLTPPGDGFAGNGTDDELFLRDGNAPLVERMLSGVRASNGSADDSAVSLAARLRLAGLDPEMNPGGGPRMRRVDLSRMRAERASRPESRKVDFFTQGLEAENRFLSGSRGIRSAAFGGGPDGRSRTGGSRTSQGAAPGMWRQEFESSLASFK